MINFDLIFEELDNATIESLERLKTDFSQQQMGLLPPNAIISNITRLNSILRVESLSDFHAILNPKTKILDSELCRLLHCLLGNLNKSRGEKQATKDIEDLFRNNKKGTYFY